jgi:hypothetical protein
MAAKFATLAWYRSRMIRIEQNSGDGWVSAANLRNRTSATRLQRAPAADSLQTRGGVALQMAGKPGDSAIFGHLVQPLGEILLMIFCRCSDGVSRRTTGRRDAGCDPGEPGGAAPC